MEILLTAIRVYFKDNVVVPLRVEQLRNIKNKNTVARWGGGGRSKRLVIQVIIRSQYFPLLDDAH